MAKHSVGPSESTLSALGQLDPRLHIDTDCVCAIHLGDKDHKLYKEILPTILTYYRDGHSLDEEGTKSRGRHLCDLAIVTPDELERGTNDVAVAGAIMKFLLYIVSKDIGVSKNKTATLVSTAVGLLCTSATETYVFKPAKTPGYDLKTPLWDPASLNDTVVEVCLDGSFDPLRIPPGEKEASKVNIKAYRSFHEVLFGILDDGWLTGHSKAIAGYLAIKLYFGDLERASEHNDMLWVTVSWLTKAAEDIFKWKHDEVTEKWSKWRTHLVDRQTQMRDARAGEGEAGALEKMLGEAAENMMKSLKHMRQTKARRAEIQERSNAALEEATTKKG
ncbi:hypothetical protein SLS62_010861 [Diatrype stigma]|uniref:Uncharacterized protein n=1 Tax=Diatrype stigma TaxID=117547 RepID=A0AAN9U7E9_9PEZI